MQGLEGGMAQGHKGVGLQGCKVTGNARTRSLEV